MAKKYTQAEWARIQAQLPEGDRVPYEESPDALESNSEGGIAAALALGITETLIKAFPELQSIFDDFAKGNIAKARIDYFSTNYYKNITTTAQGRQAKKGFT